MCLAKWVKGVKDYSVLPLRLALGSVFIAHGYQKLTSIGVANFAGMLSPLGGAALLFAWIVTLIELLGGIAVLVGFGTRYAAAGIAAVMIGAISIVHLPNGFLGQGGYEFPLTLLLVALTLVVIGAGKVLNLETKLLRKEL